MSDPAIYFSTEPPECDCLPKSKRCFDRHHEECAARCTEMHPPLWADPNPSGINRLVGDGMGYRSLRCELLEGHRSKHVTTVVLRLREATMTDIEWGDGKSTSQDSMRVTTGYPQPRPLPRRR